MALTPEGKKRRNAEHKLLCNKTDGLIGERTKARDIANLEKALASKPLHPPARKRKLRG